MGVFFPQTIELEKPWLEKETRFNDQKDKDKAFCF